MINKQQSQQPGIDNRAGSASEGDEVYFHHPEHGPVAGKVLASGAHGCTIEHDGKQHKIKWHRILGHKSPNVPSYHIVEQGEDGVIVSDQKSGKRHYLGIPPEARNERMEMIKSLLSGDSLLARK